MDNDQLQQLFESLMDADTLEEGLGSLSDLVLYELISTAEKELWTRQKKVLSSRNTVVAHAETAL